MDFEYDDEEDFEEDIFGESGFDIPYFDSHESAEDFLRKPITVSDEEELERLKEAVRTKYEREVPEEEQNEDKLTDLLDNVDVYIIEDPDLGGESYDEWADHEDFDD